MRRHLIISFLLTISLSLLLVGCAGNLPDNKEKINTKEVQEMAAYIGSDACITCHDETGKGFAMTSHAGIFKSLEQYDVDWNQTVTIWDDSNKENPVSKEFNLKNSYGVMMDDYIVAEVEEFSGKLYRIAALEKTEQGYKIAAASLKDYNTDGKQDWGAKSYSCSQCHSPGLEIQNLAVRDIESGISCETCHGPGSIHAQTKNKQSISINQSACISCHTLGKPSEAKDGDYLIAQNHYGTRNWFASEHYTSGYVNCLSCHTSHKVNVENKMLKADSFQESCAQCHKKETYDQKEVMWINPTDPYNHFTQDHSFGAFTYDMLGDKPDTKEVEITNETTVKKLKSLMKDTK
ncbi:MAG: cytochrome c3 family protein [Bacillota bacterium]